MSGNYAELYSVLCCETDARAEGLRTCMRMRHGITYLLPLSLSLSLRVCMYVLLAYIQVYAYCRCRKSLREYACCTGYVIRYTYTLAMY